MKLVEILAREMSEWPEGIIWVTQDGGAQKGRIVGFKNEAPELQDTHYWGAKGGGDWYPPMETDSEDYRTAIITREMWQAERDRIARKGNEVKSPKPNKDGWIRHRGGKCPVDEYQRIKYRMRSGVIMETPAGGLLNWEHGGWASDIMAWRPHKPEQKSLSSVAADGELWSDAKGMPSAKCFDSPIQWRDRIREIDAAIIVLNEERASLIAKLKAEGFALIQSDEPNSELESAQQDIAQQDMSDWRNWKEGDLVTVIRNEGESELVNGAQYKVVSLEDKDYDGDCPAQLKHNSCRWLYPENMKWHSRPTN